MRLRIDLLLPPAPSQVNKASPQAKPKPSSHDVCEKVCEAIELVNSNADSQPELMYLVSMFHALNKLPKLGEMQAEMLGKITDVLEKHMAQGNSGLDNQIDGTLLVKARTKVDAQGDEHASD